MKNILMTGAAGGVGTFLRELLRDSYALRLSDRATLDDLTGNETSLPADLTDAAAAQRAVQGVAGIIHLGAFAVEGTWQQILDANIVGTYNLYEAARQAGVKRIVYASSNHAVGFFERAETIDHTVYPKPDSRYGVSKVFGEALASLYADKYGVESLCVRIGNVSERPLDRRRLAIWLSPRDLAQLVKIGLDHPDIRFEIVYGASDCAPHAWWDNRNALRLGYRPQDRSDDYTEAVMREMPEEADPRERRYQGGAFVNAESGGDPFKPDVQ